jgi:hypothetical protein
MATRRCLTCGSALQTTKEGRLRCTTCRRLRDCWAVKDRRGRTMSVASLGAALIVDRELCALVSAFRGMSPAQRKRAGARALRPSREAVNASRRALRAARRALGQE